jgi:hypothetical protein
MYQCRSRAVNSWWWTERLPETCRLVIPIKLELSASVGFIHKEYITMHGHTVLKCLVAFARNLQSSLARQWALQTACIPFVTNNTDCLSYCENFWEKPQGSPSHCMLPLLCLKHVIITRSLGRPLLWWLHNRTDLYRWSPVKAKGLIWLTILWGRGEIDHSH